MVCTDILGPVNFPGITNEVERYFISFIDVVTSYAYVAQFHKRAQTPEFIDKFLKNLGRDFESQLNGSYMTTQGNIFSKWQRKCSATWKSSMFR